jgi:hypothetical protein
MLAAKTLIEALALGRMVFPDEIIQEGDWGYRYGNYR